jgi:tetratricopeptide (TPR) repeat protein
MKTVFRPLIIALLSLPLAVLAASDPEPADPVLNSAKDATARHDYAKASAILRDGLAKAPANAEYHNLYAYALRKGANPDMDLVFKHYGEALRINPKHRGAHEYIGEAYLMVGNPAKAKEHLAQLDKLCFFGCAEYSDLKKAIAEHEAKR